LFHDFEELKENVGLDQAKQIIKFRLAQLAELLQVSESEGLDQDTQARQVQTFDVFLDPDFFEETQEKLQAYLEDLPGEKPLWSIVDDPEELEVSLHFNDGAIHNLRYLRTRVHSLRYSKGSYQLCLFREMCSRHNKCLLLAQKRLLRVPVNVYWGKLVRSGFGGSDRCTKQNGWRKDLCDCSPIICNGD
jgi:hypothetical protein